jgi:hypothetical protein
VASPPEPASIYEWAVPSNLQPEPIETSSPLRLIGFAEEHFDVGGELGVVLEQEPVR